MIAGQNCGGSPRIHVPSDPENVCLSPIFSLHIRASTDNGKIPNLKFSFATARNRLTTGESTIFIPASFVLNLLVE